LIGCGKLFRFFNVISTAVNVHNVHGGYDKAGGGEQEKADADQSFHKISPKCLLDGLMKIP
jgi:hypothetical protein